MDVTYKYVLESAPITKSKKDFLKDFFSKHFKEFMDNKIILMISPELGNQRTLFQLDIDFDIGDTNLPNIEVTKVFNALNQAFDPYSFNLEITPNGCHIVSNFTYTRIHQLVEVKKQFASVLRRIKNLDLDASFSPVPLKRIGYDEKRHFFYAPHDSSNGSIRNKLFMNKNPYANAFWQDYIEKNLIPDDKDISYISLTKMLGKFEEIVKGANRSEE